MYFPITQYKQFYQPILFVERYCSMNCFCKSILFFTGAFYWNYVKMLFCSKMKAKSEKRIFSNISGATFFLKIHHSGDCISLTFNILLVPRRIMTIDSGIYYIKFQSNMLAILEILRRYYCFMNFYTIYICKEPFWNKGLFNQLFSFGEKFS